MIGAASKELVFPQTGNNPAGKELHFKLGESRVEWWTTPSGDNGYARVNGLKDAEIFAINCARMLGCIQARSIICEQACEGISFDPKIASCRGYDSRLVGMRWQRRTDREGELPVQGGLNDCRYYQLFTEIAGATERITIGENQTVIKLKPQVPVVIDFPFQERTFKI